LVFRHAVLTAIQFEVVAGLSAIEIQHVWAHLMLPPKLITCKLAIAQDAPKFFLSVGGFPAKHSGYGCGTHLEGV
jgi:hypothetical protein